jgi:hypothetical protein
MLHEPYPIQGLRRVLTIAVGGAPGMEKAFAFIVAKRVRAQVRKMGQFRGSEIANGIIFLHKYGI